MEFEKIDLEKSWNFVTDLKHCDTNFWHAECAFQVSIILIHAFLYSVLLCIDEINQYMD